jgi:hypothetical protein
MFPHRNSFSIDVLRNFVTALRNFKVKFLKELKTLNGRAAGNPLILSPTSIGNNHHPQTKKRRVRGLSSFTRSYAGYFLNAYGLIAIKNDSQTTGGGAADRLPAGGVPAQALCTMALGQKVSKGFVPYHHPPTHAHPR